MNIKLSKSDWTRIGRQMGWTKGAQMEGSMPSMTPFCKSYIETALWSSTDENGRPLKEKYDIKDIHPDTLKKMEEDCDTFTYSDEIGVLLDESGLDDERSGHNFWLSRNEHEAGFFNDNLDELQEKAPKSRVKDNAS